MVVLLGITAIVVDVGMIYAERFELQNGADAAALAIAQDCAVGNCANAAPLPRGWRVRTPTTAFPRPRQSSPEIPSQSGPAPPPRTGAPPSNTGSPQSWASIPPPWKPSQKRPGAARRRRRSFPSRPPAACSTRLPQMLSCGSPAHPPAPEQAEKPCPEPSAGWMKTRKRVAGHPLTWTRSSAGNPARAARKTAISMARSSCCRCTKAHRVRATTSPTSSTVLPPLKSLHTAGQASRDRSRVASTAPASKEPSSRWSPSRISSRSALKSSAESHSTPFSSH
ncbi:pilus assembly protein TadG-related protein [Pseudarthrobacter sp. So.54]